jgi:putative superfamily III holin-X
VIFRRNGGPPLLQLVKDATGDAQRLVRTEIVLARARFSSALKHVEIGAGMFAGAALLGTFAAAGTFTAIGLAISLELPGWASALIVVALLLGLAALLAALGRAQLRAAAAARTTGPVAIETELADTRYRLEAELEEISARLDPRHRSTNGSSGRSSIHSP